VVRTIDLQSADPEFGCHPYTYT